MDRKKKREERRKTNSQDGGQPRSDTAAEEAGLASEANRVEEQAQGSPGSPGTRPRVVVPSPQGGSLGRCRCVLRQLSE